MNGISTNNFICRGCEREVPSEKVKWIKYWPVCSPCLKVYLVGTWTRGGWGWFKEFMTACKKEV